jgi:eukaryotic-like serine/threonine-protein kinase
MEAAMSADPHLEPSDGGTKLPQDLAPLTVEAHAQPGTALANETPGSQIGNYKLLQQIGEGGMGSVWLAEQTEPVKRQVALKFIKVGMDSARVLARFEVERQALALMDHPNIAKVLDAGTTLSGRPYFVMELVKGVPITKYCDAQQLTARQRLELFVQVCHAIQHAHQKGVIHRDIKPTNVMVTEYDGKPVPKVIDFGVAKATAQKLTEMTLFTDFGVMVGTLEYMSPEQAQLNALDIDTRSDIYELGVLLYELLTGSTPLTRKQLTKCGLEEALRLIREGEPPKPSARLSESKEALPALAARQSTEPAKLTGHLRGDLDWVVMKALEKNRNRRYETANALALDIERHLHDEPVLAGPPSATYRLQKFAKRNKGPLAASALVLLALAGGMVGTTLGLVEAQQQRDDAEIARSNEAAQRKAAIAERDRAKDAEAEARSSAKRARQAAQDAQAVLRFFQDTVLAAARPAQLDGGLGIDATIRAAVDAAEPRIGETFRDNLLVEASIRNVLGKTYLYLGEARQAIEQHQRALELRKGQLGKDHPDTLSTMNDLAKAYRSAGQLQEALALFEETLKLRRATLGADHTDTLSSIANLAGAYQQAGRLKQALPLFEETLKANKTKLGDDHLTTLTVMNNLALVYQDVGRLKEAQRLHEQTLELRKIKLGVDHPSTVHSMNNLAEAYRVGGRLNEAAALHEEALKLHKVKLGTDHPNTLTSMNNLALTYQAMGRINDAVALHEETFKLREAKLGADHPDTLNSMNNLAWAYQAARRLKDALPLFEETLKLRSAVLGPDHPSTLNSMSNVASAYRAAGRLNEALPLFEETLKARQTKLGADHPNTLDSMHNLAMAYRAAGRLNESLLLYDETLRLHKTKLGADHPNTLLALNNFADAHRAAGHLIEAEGLLRESLAIREKKQPADWKTFDTQVLLGDCLLQQMKYADAEPHMLQGYEGMTRLAAKMPASPARLTAALESIVQLYEATRQEDKAALWRTKLEKHKAKTGK